MMTKKRRFGLTSAWAMLAALALALPAFAGGPIAVFSSGQAWLWADGGQNIPFNPDQGGLGTLNNAQAVLLTEDAFKAWGDVVTSTASYVNAGPLPVDVDGSNYVPWVFPASPDGLSAVVYDEDGAIFDALFGPGSGVLGFSGPEWGITATGIIIEGVAFLNGAPLLDGSIVVDTELGIQVHEFGHFTNLDHSVTNGEIAAFGDFSGPTPFDTFPLESLFQRIETMYPFALIFPDGTDFTGSSTPHPDDIAILSTLYPAANFFTDFGTITGTVLGTDSTTKVTGVNVIARNVANPYDDAVSAISSNFALFFSQFDAFTGVYTLNGLTPGATYAVFTDGILAGGFSVPPLFPLPGPEDLYNGAGESSDSSTDDPSVFVGVPSVAGVPATGIDIIFNAPGPGDDLGLGDDDNIEIPMGFSFSFCGTDYDSVFINSNGSISFGAGSNDFSESAADMLNGPPRIAGVWDDLNPPMGGTMFFLADNNTFSANFEDVPEFFSSGANTFSITLHRSSGQIDLTYGDLSLTDGLSGVSCGGQVTLGTEPSVDLSVLGATGTINGRLSPAIYEQWTFSSPQDVANSQIDITAPKEFVDQNEPNDTLGDATRIKSLPFSSGDAIGDSPLFNYTDISPLGDDVDYFEFDVTGGQTLLVQTTGNATIDTLIGLFDTVTGDLVDSDDDGGSGLLSRIQIPIAADTTLTIAVTTFPDFDFDGNGGDSGRYILEIETIEGILLDLGDDTFEEVAFDSFLFPFQGADWSSVFVNSNGSVTFGEGDTDFSESVTEFLNGPPRIAPLWDDLRPPSGGTVRVTQDATSMTVSFEDVPEFFSTGSNTFHLTMNSDGTVAIEYDGMTAGDGITGVTEGNGAADPGETDLSAGGPHPVSGTTYERFTGDFDLDLSTLMFW